MRGELPRIRTVAGGCQDHTPDPLERVLVERERKEIIRRLGSDFVHEYYGTDKPTPFIPVGVEGRRKEGRTFVWIVTAACISTPSWIVRIGVRRESILCHRSPGGFSISVREGLQSVGI